jgi:hypothetical protein
VKIPCPSRDGFTTASRRDLENRKCSWISIPFRRAWIFGSTSGAPSSEIVIAVIGPRWLGAQGESARRIDDPGDFVRLEIECALQHGVPIIPLLVDNTLMPKPGDLPPEMERLAFRNALPLHSGLDFHNHADRLINGICGLVGVEETPEANAAAADAKKDSAARKKNIRLGLLVAVAVIVGILAIGTWYLGLLQNRGRARMATSKTSAATEPRSQSAPAVNAGPVYKGTIRAQGDESGSGTPVTIALADDRKSGTMTQTSKSGDTVVKFTGVWDGPTLRAVTGEVTANPRNIQWKPESFTLRFSEDWKRGSYECNSEGILYTAELSAP